MELSKFDQSFYIDKISLLAGVDEAGRGPLAGPVVAAAVILPKSFYLDSIKDSKKISEKKRMIVYKEIIENALDVGVGICHEEEIDQINILEATYKAMKKALGSLRRKPHLTLIDGLKAKISMYNCKYIIKGDSKSQSIAAASIVAKVVRDKMMINYDKVFTEYGFAKHKGYGTKFHIEAIINNKSSPIHRKSFKPISEHLPSFLFFNTKEKLQKLAIQIIASKYVQNECNILEVFNNNKINIIHLEKNRCVASIVEYDVSNKKIIETNNYNNDKIRNEIELKEKEFKQNIELDVILVKFSKQKPKIIIEKNVFKK